MAPAEGDQAVTLLKSTFLALALLLEELPKTQLSLCWERIRKSQNRIYSSKTAPKVGKRNQRALLKTVTGRKKPFLLFLPYPAAPSVNQLLTGFSYKLHFPWQFLARAEQQLSPLECLGAHTWGA